MTKSIEITNLLLAAFLEAGGACVIGIKPSTRFSKVELDLSHFSKEALEDKIMRLGRVVGRIEDAEELKHIFSASMLGEVEDKYIRLKKRVVKERGKKCLAEN